jgi:hypothetical protein
MYESTTLSSTKTTIEDVNQTTPAVRHEYGSAAQATALDTTIEDSLRPQGMLAGSQDKIPSRQHHADANVYITVINMHVQCKVKKSHEKE